jgi:hypothetical protein
VQSWQLSDSTLPSRISQSAVRTLQEKYLTKLDALGSELESYRFPYRFCLTTELGTPETTCIKRNSIRISESDSTTVLQITGSYYAAYSRSRLDENEPVGLTFRDVILPTLKMAVAQFNADPQIQGYAVEVSHYFRTQVLGILWEAPENVAVVLPRSAAATLVKTQDPKEQRTILQQGQVFLNAEPLTLRVVPTLQTK